MAKHSRRKNRNKGSIKPSASASSKSKEGRDVSPARGQSPDSLPRANSIANCQIIDDAQLFSRGTTHHHLGECPICFLPHALDLSLATYHPCCSTFICNGCWVAAGMEERGSSCAFCRAPKASCDAEIVSRARARCDAGDAAAAHFVGQTCRYGRMGQKRNPQRAAKLYARAAGLGSTEAHFEIGNMYRSGEGVKKSASKSLFHLKTAAVNGHHGARYLLGMLEIEAGWTGRAEVNDDNAHRAVQHFVIAAKLGYEQALATIKDFYGQQCVTKEVFLEALLGYQRAVEERKSLQREIAVKRLEGKRKEVHYQYGETLTQTFIGLCDEEMS